VESATTPTLTRENKLETTPVIGSWTGGKGNWKAKVAKGQAKEGDKIKLVSRYGNETIVVLGVMAGEVVDFSGVAFETFTFVKFVA
jgi:hypothetical protein